MLANEKSAAMVVVLMRGVMCRDTAVFSFLHTMTAVHLTMLLLLVVYDSPFSCEILHFSSSHNRCYPPATTAFFLLLRSFDFLRRSNAFCDESAAATGPGPFGDIYKEITGVAPAHYCSSPHDVNFSHASTLLEFSLMMSYL